MNVFLKYFIKIHVFKGKELLHLLKQNILRMEKNIDDNLRQVRSSDQAKKPLHQVPQVPQRASVTEWLRSLTSPRTLDSFI
jgi:hypothetical protein